MSSTNLSFKNRTNARYKSYVQDRMDMYQTNFCGLGMDGIYTLGTDVIRCLVIEYPLSNEQYDSSEV